MEQNIDLRLFPGALQFEKFQLLVDLQVEDFYKSNNNFSMAMIDFVIKPDKRLLYSNESIVKGIAVSISQNIYKATDMYTFMGKTKFLILFPQRSKNFVDNIINKISLDVSEKFNDAIDFNVGVSECPYDGVSFKSLYDVAFNNIYNFEPILKHKSTNVEKARNWQQEITRSLENIENNIKSQLFKELSSLIQIINEYDPYLGEHSALVAQGTIIFSKEFGLPWNEIEKIAIASLLHDVGYTAIPKEIYAKRAKLLPEEWKIIKLHPVIASDHILKNISILDEYLPLIENHHEFLDGSGYPRGKRGDDIPLGSQIISIIDTYQAIKVDRPYRKAMSFEQIIDLYIQNAGIKWDAELITIFTALVADDETRKKFSEKDALSFSFSMLANQ